MVSKREVERLSQPAKKRAEASGAAPEVRIPAGGIIEFVTWLGVDLFPIQALILKIVTLSVHLFTDFDYEQIATWMRGFVPNDMGTSFEGRHGTTPDLLERMRWCIAAGRTSFRHAVLVIGRRGSKSLLSPTSISVSLPTGWEPGFLERALSRPRNLPLISEPAKYASEGRQTNGTRYRHRARL